MNSIDLIVLIVLLLNGILGAIRGFLWQAIRLAAVLLAIAGARVLAEPAQKAFQRTVGWEPLDNILVWYAIVGALVWILMTLLARAARNWVEKVKLRDADRSLGFLLGTLKGGFFVAIAFQVLFILPSALLPGAVNQHLLGGDGVRPSKAYALHCRVLASQLRDGLPQEVKDQLPPPEDG